MPFLMAFLVYVLAGFSYVSSDLEPVYNEVVADVKEITSTYKSCSPRGFNSKLYVTSVDPEVMPEEALGICMYQLIHRSIWIDRKYWQAADDSDRYSLMAHEYAHCALDKEHSLDYNNYMFFLAVRLPKESVKIQLQADVKKYCDKP